MQERIKAARHNDAMYNLIAVVGIIIAVAIPFIMRFVVHYTMDIWSSLLTIVGIVLFVGSIIGTWYDNNSVKKLIEQLEKGQEEEVEEREEENSEEKEEEKT
jgi:predicted tellurium resistance membrane protein TerC